jgi:imidazolonepropionase-like amidohydrolase
MVHHELALFVRGGIRPADAIRMATLEPARAMKKDEESGSIDKGKTADLVVIDGDPLVRIDDMGRVVTTVKSGVVYASAPLYATLGVKPL